MDIEELEELEKKQVSLEYKYHPKRKRDMLEDMIIPNKEDNDIIWSSVYNVVRDNVPDVISDRGIVEEDEWVNKTTMNFLTKIIDLDKANTPIQSIVFAFVDKLDKAANAVLSVQILLEIAEKSPVIDIKVGTTFTGDTSVTVYPKIGMGVSDKLSLKKLYSGLPMLCKPRDWTNNYDGGYLTDMCKTNIILGGVLKEHSRPINYKAINYLQSIGFRINETFFNTVQDEKEERWVEQPNGKKVKTGYVNNRMITQFYIDAKVPFYFVQRADNRTRTYSTGYNLNNQGYDYQKAVLNFAEKEELTTDGIYWMTVAIAGLYGLDKETFDTREDWYNRNISSLVSRAVARNDVSICTLNMDFIKLVEEAEEPALFKATVINIIEAHIK